MLRIFQLSLAVGILLATCVTTRAAYIPLLRDLDTGATIFDDNFEGLTAGSSLATSTATTGTWATGGAGSLTVVDSAAGIAANEGSRLLRAVAPTGTTWFDARGTGDASKSGDSDNIQLQLAFQMTSGVETSIYLRGGSESTVDLFQLGIWGPDSTYSGATAPNKVPAVIGGSWVDTGFSQDPNAWNILTVTHTNGTTDWSISVNGGTAFNATGSDAGLTNNLTGIRIITEAAPGVIWFDAVPVPEPSTMTLATMGLLGLLAYAWRRRK